MERRTARRQQVNSASAGQPMQSYLHTVRLYANTGIGDGNYVAWDMMGSSQNNVNSWFDDYQVGDTVENLSMPHISPNTNADNVDAIHVNYSYEQLIDWGLDYISWESSKSDPNSSGNSGARRFYGIVVGLEQVNPKSTRIHYAVDWCASFWDKITVGKCNIIRRSENPDDQPYTNNTAENFSIAIARREQLGYDVSLPDPIGNNTLSLYDFTVALTCSSVLSIVAQFALTGSGSDVVVDDETAKICFQLGSAITGFTYLFTEADYNSNTKASLIAKGYEGYGADSKRMTLDTFLHTVISAGRGLWKSGQPIMSAITSATFIPAWVAKATTPCGGQNSIDSPYINIDMSSGWLNPEQKAKITIAANLLNNLLIPAISALPPQAPLYIPNLTGFSTWDLDNLTDYCHKAKVLPANKTIKNNKTLNCLTYSMIGATGEATITPFQLEKWQTIPINGWASGGAEGCLTLGIGVRGVEQNILTQPSVSTPQWASIAISGSLTTQYGSTPAGRTAWNLGKLLATTTPFNAVFNGMGY